jgi:hypothetical protein
MDKLSQGRLESYNDAPDSMTLENKPVCRTAPSFKGMDACGNENRICTNMARKPFDRCAMSPE